MKTSNQLAKLTSLRLAPPSVLAIALLAALSAPAIFAQDAGGNSLLTGSYRFRYVATLNYNQTTGAVSETLASEGVITFDGAGNYAIAAGSQYLDNTVKGGAFQTIPTGTTGTYVINSAGLGYITNPLLSGEYIFGSLTDGVFTGSTTESGQALNDLFIAILPGTPPTNSSFTSPYWIGALDFAIGTDADLKNAMFEITPNGSGGLGSITVQGQANSQGQTALSQTISGGTYNFAADGNAQLSLPAPSGASTPAIMISGSRTMYVSADGNYVLGWNPAGYDILFGVKALTASGTDSLYSGLYYVSGLSDTPPISGQPQCSTQSFWGSYSADGMQDEVEHQRLWSPFCSNGNSTDYATDNYTAISANGTAQDSLGNLLVFGAGGKGFIAISNSLGNFGLTIGVHSPSYTPSSVFLNPVGVVNAANWDPITAGVAPGELITLFGSGLAATTVISTGGQPFPTMLGNVQVMINGTAAPIYYVSPTQISVIAPYGLINVLTNNGYQAPVQVNNGGFLSNQISIYVTDAESGYFSIGQNGIGDAIAEHANGSFVTESSPAAPGETIVMALTGMGLVTPSIPDGGIGPSSPLSYANNFTTANELLVNFNDYINNSTQQQATVSYAGLYPGLAGLYQMNVTVPATVGPGDVYVEIITDAADVEQVTIPVSGSTSANFSRSRLLPQMLVPLPPPLKDQRAAPHARRTTGLIPSAPRRIQ